MEVRREQADRRLVPSPPTPRKEKRGNSRVQEERAVAQLVSRQGRVGPAESTLESEGVVWCANKQTWNCLYCSYPKRYVLSIVRLHGPIRAN